MTLDEWDQLARDARTRSAAVLTLLTQLDPVLDLSAVRVELQYQLLEMARVAVERAQTAAYDRT